MLSSQKSRSLSRVFDELMVLRREQCTGHLLVRGQNNYPWSIYIQSGQILYVTGGAHSVRRWRRRLFQTAPELTETMLQSLIAQVQQSLGPQGQMRLCGEYELLSQLLVKSYLAGGQVQQVIEAIINEIFIDMLRHREISCKFYPGETIDPLLAQFDPQKLGQQQQQEWQQWSNSSLSDYGLDQAPIIISQADLKAATSATAYVNLVKLLNGDQSFWDLAAKMQRSALDILQSLVPHLQTGVIGVQEIADQPPLFAPIIPSQAVLKQQPLIACVDDSLAICQTVETMVTGAGYRFLAISEAVRAIPQLLAKKPNLILLDLRMPVTNGYEICSQLRRLSTFKNTPIVILTGSDGIIDRSRARLVGATDYLNKNISPKQLLATLEQYLQPVSV
jgi:two-component system, chemotaxis family, response regulator PixG